jgi:hypothetical protein
MPTFEKSLPPKQTILLFSISLLSLTLIVSYAVGNLAQLNQIYDRFADISWTTWSKAIIDRWPIKTLDEVTNIAPAVTNLSFVLVSDSNVTILTGEVPVQHRCVLKLDTTLETQLVCTFKTKYGVGPIERVACAKCFMSHSQILAARLCSNAVLDCLNAES